MAWPVAAFGTERRANAPDAEERLAVVPGPWARRILAFEFLVLAEYWLSPLFLGISNYAGLWAELGTGLFFVFVASLVGLVLWPLRRHLKAATARRREFWAFHGVWIGALVAAMFLTNTFQLGVPASAPGYSPGLGLTTVYTPFGAWPSLTVYVPSAHFYGTLNPELLVIVGLTSILGSAAIRLGAHRRAGRCALGEVRADRPGRLARVAAVAVWSPLGLITGCASCAPLYLAAAGLLVPAVADGGLSAVPLVPWIGLAGLLYLASFGLALVLLVRATAPLAPGATTEVQA